MDKGADDGHGLRQADDPDGTFDESVKVSGVLKGIQAGTGRDPDVAVAESRGAGEIGLRCETAMGDFGIFSFDGQFGFYNAVAETNVSAGNSKGSCDLKVFKTDVAA